MNPFQVSIKLWKSLVYSLQGLAHITQHELSFQLLLIYGGVSFIALYLLPFTIWEKVVLISTTLLLLVAEIFNTALETIVNRVSPEKSDFARITKDLGSAAVFLILIASFLQWIFFLKFHFNLF